LRPGARRIGSSPEPGLYFVGLRYLYAFSSDMIHGVDRDAARVAAAVAACEAARPSLAEPALAG
jgi:putative flavoprotein involved in K+ transport